MPAPQRSLLGRTVATAAALLALGSQSALAATLVTNGNDAGPGSLRAALAAASTGPGAMPVIIVDTVSDIQLQSTLDYTGERPLQLFGQGQVISTSENVTLLQSSTGSSMKISGLTFAGPGGFSIESRGDENGETAGKGIFIDVADDAAGRVQLLLEDVVVRDVANHGIHVSDCTLADDCGGGGGGAGEGSPASILVHLNNVSVEDVGNGRFDADGVRVDERGEGSVVFRAINSSFTGVGADGVELDEGQGGGVVAEVSGSFFNDNGAYCDPALLADFLPDPDEAEFEDGEATGADIPGPVIGSPDDRCFEREVDYYESGAVETYEFGIDTDDGFDIDEAGGGSIRAVVVDSEVSGNYDEGLDFDEEDAGAIILDIDSLVGNDNVDDAVKLSEEGGGDVRSTVSGSTIGANDGKGIVLEEADGGDLEGLVVETELADNDDGGTDIEAVQEDDGTGTLTLRDTFYTGEVEVEGVDLIEE